MNWDKHLFILINGWAGKLPWVDEIIKGLANDYFLLICICLLLVFLWFGTRDRMRRDSLQRGILIALSAMGIVNGFVGLSNHYIFRIRPFNALPDGSVNLLFYRPTDSSFPSNFSAVVFSIAFAVLLINRKWGIILLAVALVGGFSRVYVGIHYPLDILGGAAMGAFAAVTAYGFLKLIEPVMALVLKILRQIHLA